MRLIIGLLLFLFIIPPVLPLVQAQEQELVPLTTDNERRFGFGFVSIGWMRTRFWDADNFFNGMFLTPPYPSTVQFFLPGGIQQFGETRHNDFLLRVMERASDYPNIKITLVVGWTNAFDPVEKQAFEDFLDRMRNSPWADSVASVGMDLEHLRIGSNINANATQRVELMDWMQGEVFERGYQFISYYPQSFPVGNIPGITQAEADAIKARFDVQFHTNFPSGGHLGLVRNGGVGQSRMVGITSGLDGKIIFPSPGCEAPFNARTPGYNIVRFEEGFMPSAEEQAKWFDPDFNGNQRPTFAPCHNQLNDEDGFDPSIREVLKAYANRPIENARYNHLITGGSAFGHSDQSQTRFFSGDLSTGMINEWTDETSVLWWHTQFRGEMWDWIQNNPNDFLLGTDPVTTPPPPPEPEPNLEPPPNEGGNGGGGDPDEPQEPISSLIAHYRFNEASGDTALDSSLNNNVGTLVGGPERSLGKDGNALSFDGSSYVMVNNDPSLAVGELTLMAWISPSSYPLSHSYPSDHSVVLSKEDSYQMAIFDDKSLRFAIRTSPDTWEWVNTGEIIDLNTWTHIAITYDGITAKLYIDSVLVHQVYMANAVVSSDYPLGIGARYLTGVQLGDWGAHFIGKIDEIKIFNEALTGTEISAEFMPPISSLIAHYRFNEASGDTALDSSLNNNVGTLVGGPERSLGKDGNALSFDGSSYVMVNNDPSLAVGELTLMAWISPSSYPTSNSYPSDHSIVLSKEDSYQMAIFNDRTLRFAIRTSANNWGWVNTGEIIDLNTWTHIAITYDGITAKLYIDSVLVHQVYMANAVVSSDYPLGIGARYLTGVQLGDWGAHFIGKIDEIKIFNAALITEEIFTEFEENAVLEFDYSVSVGDMSVVQGSTGSTSVDLSLAQGVPEAVSISISGLPSGTSSFLSAESCTPSCSLTLYIATTDQVQVGSYELTVMGTPFARSLTFLLTIDSAAPEAADVPPLAEEPQPAGAEEPQPAGAEEPQPAGAEEPQPAGAEEPQPAGAEEPGAEVGPIGALIREYIFISPDRDLSEFHIQIDGQEFSIPVLMNWEDGSVHEILVEEFVQISSDERFRFDGWSGVRSSTFSHLTIVAQESAAGTYSVNFNVQFNVQLELNLLESSMITPPPGSYWIDAGDTFEVRVMESPAYTLDEWILNGNGMGADSHLIFEVNSAQVVRAVVGPRLYSIVINPAGGIIYLDGSRIDNAVTYQWPYLSTHTIEGEELVQLTEDSRLRFRSWSDGSRSLQREIVVTGDTTYSPLWFQEYRVIIKEFEGGFLSYAAGEYWFLENEILEIRAMSATNYSLGDWIVNGERILSEGTLLLSINSPYTLEIIFNPDSYSVEIDAADGLVFVEGLEQYGQVVVQSSYGDTVLVRAQETIQLSDSTRLVFVGWSDNVDDAERLLDIKSDVAIRALWATEHYLTVLSKFGNPIGGGWYREGSIAAFQLDYSSPSLENKLRGYLIDGIFFQEHSGMVLMDSPHTIVFDWIGSVTNSGQAPDPIQLNISSLAMAVGGAGMIVSTVSLSAVKVKSSKLPKKVSDLVGRLKKSSSPEEPKH